MFKSFIKGLVIGGGVFGSIALLNNKNTGDVNRQKVKDYSREVEGATRSLTQSIANLQNAFTDLADQSQTTLVSVQKSVSDISSSFIDRSEPQLMNLMHRVDQLKHDLKIAQDRLESAKARHVDEEPEDDENDD